MTDSNFNFFYQRTIYIVLNDASKIFKMFPDILQVIQLNHVGLNCISSGDACMLFLFIL